MHRRARRHPSLKKTNAAFAWSMDHPRAFERIDPRYHFLREYDLVARGGWPGSLIGPVFGLFTGGRRPYGLAAFDVDQWPDGRR